MAKTAWEHFKGRAKRAGGWSPWQDIVVAIAAAVIGYFVLGRESARENAVIAVVVGLSAAAVWQGLRFIWRFFWAVPKEIDEELDDRVAELTKEINSLTLQLEKEKDRNRPKLSGAVFDLISAPLKDVNGVRAEFIGKYETFVIFRAAVSNNGTPSIAKWWRLEVRTANGKKETAQKTTIPFHSTTLGKMEPIFGVDALDEKTYPKPIPNGAEIPGALGFLLASISCHELMENGSQATLFFFDNTGVEYSVVWTPGGPASPYKHITGFQRARPPQ